MILSDLGAAAAAAAGTVPEAGIPFGFCFGPIIALEALARDNPLPPACFAHDWEQLARVIVATASGVKLVLDSLGPSQMLDAWRAADASLLRKAAGSSTAARFHHLLQLAATDPFNSGEFSDVIRSLMP